MKLLFSYTFKMKYCEKFYFHHASYHLSACANSSNIVQISTKMILGEFLLKSILTAQLRLKQVIVTGALCQSLTWNEKNFVKVPNFVSTQYWKSQITNDSSTDTLNTSSKQAWWQTRYLARTRRERVVRVMFWLLYTKGKICPVPAV